MHLGGGGLSSDLGNDLLAIPFDGLAMIESLEEYSTYLLKRTRGGGARLRRPSRERTLTILLAFVSTVNHGEAGLECL